MHPLIALENLYAASNYLPLPVMLARGEGVWLWDDAGRRYLDLMSADSAVSFGHANPVLLRALTDQAGRLAVTSRAFHTDQLGPFLARLCDLPPHREDGGCSALDRRLTGYHRALVPGVRGAELPISQNLSAARRRVRDHRSALPATLRK